MFAVQTANCASSSSTWCLSGGFSKSPIRQIFLFQKLKTLQLKSGSTLYGNKTAVFTICSARRRRPSFDVSHRNCRLCHTFLYQPFRVSLHQINRLNLLMTHQTYHQTKKKCDFCFLPVTSRFLRLNTKLTAHISYTHIEDDVQRRMNFQ